ncbi:MAG: DUF4368 domain-containing protein [Oscillospiraceae bacterium]|nr:DUF4368 domain-containing protein [Oscillospiraceae bacterium]
MIISQLYEDHVFGKLSVERYQKMVADYETEQEQLRLEIEVTEDWIETREEMGDNVDAFIALTEKYVDVTNLTATLVNEYIKKIIVFAPDKSSGRRQQELKIVFNFVDELDIPAISESIICKQPTNNRRTA